MRKIVVAFDSFKGSLTSREATCAVCEVLSAYKPDIAVDAIPVCDGGEGTMTIITDALHGTPMSLGAVDALMRPVSVTVGVEGECAIVDMASVVGLAMIEPQLRNPMNTSTYGLGVVLKSLIDRGCRRIILGIGGSATNDAGLGAMQALGLVCYNKSGNLIEQPITGGMLSDVSKIDNSILKKVLCGVAIDVICDVRNHFYGRNGAARVFGPQKGATPEMVRELDAGLKRVNVLFHDCCRISVARRQYAGAAGGLGGALLALTNATFHSGIDYILDIMGFNRRINGADYVFTGEGAVDMQSLMGKVLSGILSRAQEQGVAVVSFGGKVSDRDNLLAAGVADVVQVTPDGMPLEMAMRADVARENIKIAVHNWLVDTKL